MRFCTALACVVVLAAGSAGARAQESALSYTLQQSEQGRAAYVANCMVCHGPHLADGPLGKPLKGPAFMQKYGGRSVRELYDVTRTTMPSTKPGSLDSATYAALVAYMLHENAVVAGKVALPTDPRELAHMMVPGGGFSIMAYSPYTAQKPVVLPNPLDHLHSRRQSGSREPAASGLADLASGLGRPRFQPVDADHGGQRRESAAGVELVAASRFQ